MMLHRVKHIFHQNKYLLRRIVLIILLALALVYSLHPNRFACYYTYIEDNRILSQIEPSPQAIALAKKIERPLCHLVHNTSDNIMYYPNVNINEFDLDELSKRLNISLGGYWKPQECISTIQTAIIVPFRNRTSQLKVFLSYMHPFLQKQMIDYRIIIVEQSNKGAFNRAKLFNIGFVESIKLFPYHCFIFHDIDLIPQKINNIYGCTHQPRHMSSSVNTFRYNLPYQELFGGAVSILGKQFQLVNGFSNLFFGWGGEDDDFHRRIAHKGLTICRFSPSVARYFMLSHAKELPSENRFVNLKLGRERFETDGLKTLKYKVLKRVYEPLYTWILVDL